MFTGEDTDVDGDSSVTCADCDDNDVANFPGNTEICDGADNDCDATTVFTGEDTDVDGDSSITCADCDDNDINNVPGGTELCDGQDNDCDATTVFTGEDTDVDGDSSITCLDCDDNDINNVPGGTEVCDGQDNDCDATTVFTGEDTDVDGDGAITCLDCEDGDINVFPGQTEICNDADDDCDATTFATGEDMDVDTDGVVACLDCDDNDIDNLPGGSEVCDGGDNDCDPSTGINPTMFESAGTSLDNATNSGAVGRQIVNLYTATSSATLNQVEIYTESSAAPTLTAIVFERATSSDPWTFVGSAPIAVVPTTAGWTASDAFAVELAAGMQYAIGYHKVGAANDYYGSADPDPSWGTWDAWSASDDAAPTPDTAYVEDSGAGSGEWSIRIHSHEDVDADGDLQAVCGGDCDDSDALVYTGAPELCDLIDNDCDVTTFATGEDTDGDGDQAVTCLDCDDTDDQIFPGQTEVCDGIDNDCDATTFATDEGTDVDGDGVVTCLDCDDNAITVFDGAPELCDGLDNDCDGGTASTLITGTQTHTSSGGNRWRSNLFEPAGDFLLNHFAYELTATAGTELTFAVYEGASQSGTFTELASHTRTVSAANAGSAVHHESLDFALDLTAGNFYVLAVHWDDSATYYWTRPYTSAFTEGNFYDPPGGAGAVPSGTFDTSSYTDYPNSYPTTIVFNDEGDGDGDGELACADCDDTDSGVNTSATVETCDVDTDCDGIVPGSEFELSDSPALATVDGGDATATLDVSLPGAITEVTLEVDITHTDVSELSLLLTSPSGTPIGIYSGTGPVAADMTGTVFDDDAVDVITPGSAAPLSGDWLTDIPLGLLDGEPPSGTWTLTVSDAAGGSTGTLNSWTLTIGTDEVGEGDTCAPESCATLAALRPLAGDTDYLIDPDGNGASPHSCLMTADGGGWTLVMGWDRENFADGITEFEQEWDTFVNGMSVYQELTSSLQWQDGDASYDVLDGYRGVLVPNSGEVRYDLHFEGVSMEASGVWFSVETAAGYEELACNDDATGVSAYDASEQAYIPYACSTVYTDDPLWDATSLTTATGEVTGVGLTSLMADINGGDDAQLFRFSVWVR